MTEIFGLSNEEILKRNLELSYSQQREYYLDYISLHYFDEDRHLVLQKLFNDIIYEKSFLEKGFQMESLEAVDKTRLIRQMLEYQVEIPKNVYLKIFNLEGYYDFPTLICDERGIFTGGVEDFIILDYFTITNINGIRHFCKRLPITPSELELFEVITGEKINQVIIDLQMGDKRDFVNHSCNIYPPTIKNVASIYDTLYLSDFILKYMYNLFLQMVALGKKNEVLLENFIVSHRAIGGIFKVANLKGVHGFTKLVNTIRLFILKNGLQHRVEEFRESYLSIQRDRKYLSNVNVSIHYHSIDYTIEKEEKNDNEITHIEIQPVRPNIKIVPTHPSFKEEKLFGVVEMFKVFVEVHYNDIKTAFPVYNRLENIYRVCGLVNILSHKREGMDSFSVSLEEKDTVFVEKFAHSIACTGGISVAPTVHNRVEKKPDKELVKVCREAFDNGGLICAFAPKLKIRECYDKNLQDFHECLEDKKD